MNRQHLSVSDIRTKRRIQNTLFSLQITNGPNKLECYNTLVWKGLTLTKNLAYWTSQQVMKKMRCCEYDSKTQRYQTFMINLECSRRSLMFVGKTRVLPWSGVHERYFTRVGSGIKRKHQTRLERPAGANTLNYYQQS